MINPTQIPTVKPRIMLREDFDDWGILFDQDNARSSGINPIGVEIWKLMDGERNVEEITAELRGAVEDPPEHISDDVVLFITSLIEQGFVEIK